MDAFPAFRWTEMSTCVVCPAEIVVRFFRMEPIGTTRISFLQRLGERTDQLSWAEFHGRYGELLYRYARRRGAAHAEAEEVVQDVEMYLFRAMNGFQYDKKKGRFRSYLRASVVRAMGRRASKRAKQETPLDPQALDTFTRDDTRADDQWEREWQLHRLRWALRSISGEFEPTTLQAFCLHVLANRSVTDTAAHLGMSTASVYQAKSRILKRLRERINALDTEEED